MYSRIRVQVIFIADHVFIIVSLPKGFFQISLPRFYPLGDLRFELPDNGSNRTCFKTLRRFFVRRGDPLGRPFLVVQTKYGMEMIRHDYVSIQRNIWSQPGGLQPLRFNQPAPIVQADFIVNHPG